MTKEYQEKEKYPDINPIFKRLHKFFKHKYKIYLLPVFLIIILLILIYTSYDMFMEDKFYPFTFAGDTQISFLSLEQTINTLSEKINQRDNQEIKFVNKGVSYTINLTDSSPQVDYSTLEKEFDRTHQQFVINRLVAQTNSLINAKFIDPEISFKLDPQLEPIVNSVYIPSQNAQLIFNETKTLEGSPSADIQLIEGKNGIEVDKEELQNEVKKYLLTGNYDSNLPTKVTQPKITSEYLQKLKKILEDSYKNSIKLIFEDKEFTLDTKQLLAILDLESGQNAILDREKTFIFLEKIAQDLNQEVQEGKFEFDPQTKRVKEFKASSPGRKLDIEKTYSTLLETLNNTGTNKIVTLPVEVVEPKIKTSEVNDLGIQELLGQGISHFSGSITNRIYNLGLAASRINGVLIPPGEVFSFNNSVGDISGASGYKPAYVIKSGRTVLDDGGGVCQVSTTVFRAALNAGLPIVQRVAHAYRVGYYEQGFPPGLDATVFSPSVDFKFKNDTNNHILLQAYVVGSSLYVDIYGTSDGRFVDMTKPVISNVTPPPQEIRQDDPTLPKGEIKQVDWPAYGATVFFNRTVKRDNQVLIEETFRSNYKAWQAVYLVGTKEN